MAHTMVYDPELNCITTMVQGQIKLDEMKVIDSGSIKTAVSNRTFLLLNDFRDATISLGPVDIFGLPRTFLEEVRPYGFPVYRFKRAIIVSKDFVNSDFYENVICNQGQVAKIFFEIDEAKEWLFQGKQM
jgi:hypothetical protein